MSWLLLAASPRFDALKLCFETQFLCLQLEDVHFHSRLNSFSASAPHTLFLFAIVRKVACFCLLWIYPSCRWSAASESWRGSREPPPSYGTAVRGSGWGAGRAGCQHIAEITRELETLLSHSVCRTLALYKKNRKKENIFHAAFISQKMESQGSGRLCRHRFRNKALSCTSCGVFACQQYSASFLGQCRGYVCATDPEIHLQLMWHRLSNAAVGSSAAVVAW